MPVSKFFSIAFLLIAVLAVACGGPSSVPGGGESGELPDITDDMIRERINHAWLREVPEENGIAAPISWNFDEDEPKEITVIDKQVDGKKATIVLDVKTGSSPRARAKRQLAGQIRTEWKLETGLALRRWEIVKTENISMKYKDIGLPANSNTNANTTTAN